MENDDSLSGADWHDAGPYPGYVALLLNKLAPEGALITNAELEAFTRETRFVFAQGQDNGLFLKLVTREEAQRLIDHDKSMQGRA